MNTKSRPVTARHLALLSKLHECHQLLSTAIISHQKLNRQIRLFMIIYRFLPFKAVVRRCRRQYDYVDAQFEIVEKLRQHLLIASLTYNSKKLSGLSPNLSRLFCLHEETISYMEEQSKLTQFPRTFENMQRVAHHLRENIQMMFQVIDAGLQIQVNEPVCLN